MVTNFKLDLSIGHFQTRSMSLAVYADSRPIFSQSQIDSSKLHLEFDHDLPVTVILRASGKGLFDTEIDVNGDIVADKFVRIDSILIDNMPISKWILESRAIKFVPMRGSSRFTNYLASDGEAILTISESDSFEFFLALLSQQHSG